MKHNENALRSALDARLGALTASPERRANIRQAIARKEKPMMKRKMMISLALLLAALLLTGAAVAVGVNLFDLFGQSDERLTKLAPDAVPADAPAVQVESNAIGQTNAAIANAYYDGQSLLVGYIIQNGTRCEAFTPTAEQLAQMESSDTLIMPAATSATTELLTQYRRAVEAGAPFGVVIYTIDPSDHTETDDGIDLPPSTETSQTAADGTLYTLREYESPLPQAAQDRDSLTLQIRLWQNAYYLYFDGSRCYIMTDRQPAEPMTATVSRTEGGVRVFSGEGAYEGLPLTLRAEVSAVSAHVTVTAAQPWPALKDDAWYEVVLLDETGRSFRMQEFAFADPQTLVVSFDGTGTLPETLKAFIYLAQEGRWYEPEATITPTEPMILTCMNQ